MDNPQQQMPQQPTNPQEETQGQQPSPDPNDPVMAHYQPQEEKNYKPFIIGGIVIIIIAAIISIFMLFDFSEVNAESTTTTLLTTSTKQTTTTTATTSTTTTTIPDFVRISGLPVGDVFFYFPVDTYKNEWLDTSFDNISYSIPYTQVCEAGDPKYDNVRLRYESPGNSLIKYIDITDDYCKTGQIKAKLE